MTDNTPNTTNTPYTAAVNAVSAWCAENGFAARSEFLTQGDGVTPEKFVLWRIENEIGRRHKDNTEPFVEYLYSFYVGLADTPENRAALYSYHWALRSVLVGAGFFPQDGYEIGIDKDCGRVYILKEYAKTFEAGDIIV